ncbi:GPI-anchored protein LLG1-like [Gastrolobium bilobum]|uniref:GPI-anchored protein LLG1-like n=1 Tax=Gastrolobium bilobum TaxID=150636 RepID=UPI002AAF4374|nr:GPI-anchored protein LLG1-like [Gastrolobium bilobum]
MGSNAFFSSILYFFFLATLVSASPFLSDDIFDSGVSTGRALLQAKKACGVNFENQNYTILTSQCKGPQYPPKVCCEAFKQFACPFADQISDMTTDCASVMFSYINIYGKYPPGLFANQCKEGKEGLDCSEVKPSNSSDTSNTFHVAAPSSMLLMTTAGFLGFLFHFF